MGSLNIIDLIILLIFFFCILIGFIRGLVTEIVSLIALIAAFFCAAMFANPIAQAFLNSESGHDVINQTTNALGVTTSTPISYAAIGISFGIIFTLVLIIGAILKIILNLPFQAGILGLGNRIFGAGFGFLKGFLYNLVFIFVVQLSPLAAKPTWQESKLVKDFQPTVIWLGNIVSPALTDLKNHFGGTIQDINSTMKTMSNSI